MSQLRYYKEQQKREGGCISSYLLLIYYQVGGIIFSCKFPRTLSSFLYNLLYIYNIYKGTLFLRRIFVQIKTNQILNPNLRK